MKIKNITLTLYLKYKSDSGTILVQGRGCPDWADKEFPLLETIVKDAISSPDLSWREAVHTVPMYFSTDAPIAVPLSPAAEGGSVSSSDPLPEEARDQTAVKQHPTSRPSNKKQKQRRWATVFSPVGERLRSRAKPIPSVPVSVLNRLTQLQLDLEELSTTQTHFQNQVKSTSEDIKTSAKNEIRPLINSKCEDLIQHIEALEARVANIEKQNAQLQKENQSLKTQVGTLQANMKKIKPKTTTNADTQTPSTEGQHTTSPYTPSQAIEPTNNETLHGNTQHTSNLTTHTLTDSQKPDPVNSDNSSTPHYTIQTSNSFMVLADNTVPKKETSNQTKTTQGDSKTEANIPREVTMGKRSPKEILSKIKINEHATVVLIGDSIIRNINSQRVSHHKCQKICVSGMTVGDVREWVSKLPAHPSIHQITLHVGVNNCPNGQVTEREWADLIDCCQRAFPRALIRLSSIIPARGWHNLNNTIFPSNRQLAAVCEKHGAVFINNHSTFTAQSGAPRLDLYKDVTHPSAKGTAKLAVSLMLDNQQLSGLSDCSSPDNEHQNIRYRDVRPRTRQPRVQQGSQSTTVLPNPPTSIYDHPPPSSLYHYPPLLSDPKPSTPLPPPPVHPWYQSRESLPASADWDATSRDVPVRHPGNRSAPRSPPVYPPLATSNQRPGPASMMQCVPSARPLPPMAVHYLNMAAQLYAQHAVY